jgi:hypothetical protein
MSPRRRVGALEGTELGEPSESFTTELTVQTEPDYLSPLTLLPLW